MYLITNPWQHGTILRAAVLRPAILMCLLAIGLVAQSWASPGDWKLLGKAGDWKNTVAGVTLQGQLYSIEDGGALYVTDLATGAWQPVGSGGLTNTTLLVTNGRALYDIDTNGDLNRIATKSGVASRLGKAGDWKNTLAGAVIGNTLYTAEGSGRLYGTDLATGEWRQIGKPDFAKTAYMFATPDALFTIEQDGSLYKINPADGTWAQVGKAGNWKGTLAGAILGGRLYTTEKSGILYTTDLDDGSWRKIGKPDFAKTAYMFATDGGLYTIEQDGSLYAIESEPLAG